MILENSDKRQSNTVLGIVVSILLFFAALLIPKLLKLALSLSDETILWISRLAIWLALFILWLYSQRIEKQSLLLWEEKKYSVWHYVLSIISTLLIVVLVLAVFSIIWILFGFKKDGAAMQKVMEVLKHNDFLILFTCITAGITEELVFRGYLIPRLQFLFNKTYVSIIISSLLFGLIHFGYGTALNVIGPFIIGIVFALHYYKFRNIKILIICHFLWDYLVILLKSNFQTPTNP